MQKIGELAGVIPVTPRDWKALSARAMPSCGVVRGRFKY